MIHVAIRVRELVSSNVDSLVSRAGDQRKMLRLLQSEIEETLITLYGDLAKLRRAHERKVQTAAKLAETAEEWTAKAKVAVDHKREDLARAALLTRESDRKRVAAMRAEAATLAEELAEIEAAVAELETKRAQVGARIAAATGDAEGSADADAGSDSRTARRLDRIDALDRRASFAEKESDEPSPDAVDAEIAALGQASAIDAELAAMKQPAKRARKKAK
ncbi:PspA/IM30 family protein [Erythrobacter sp. JK5]|uniref:PspA/IM30 family protein n=1 Tax=Erythrobacter sp. JK5 TaxID=2829500 RepID=UPI001BA500EC|nr:PspA/IM30 family protein [Erythrobacter sp. JK5]QUL36811.1 PspA/IM30 family protein [Erythrobacter sp. JK5]